MVLNVISSQRTYTNSEFEALPEFDEHYELLDGRIVKKDMGGDDHARIIRRLTKIYDRFDPDAQTVTVYTENSFSPTILKPENDLEGGEIIPNFKIKVADLFK